MVNTIALDPGHRRSTAGKAVHPYYEWESNQRIAVIMKRMLEASGFKVFYTIDINSDWDKPVFERGVAGRRADLLVSIHNNAHGDTRVRGTETFVHLNSTASVPVAQAIQSAMVKSLGTINRGVKKADFGVLRGAYQHTLAVLLEGEFFTNAAARKWMMTHDFDLRYAAGAVQGICNYAGKKFMGEIVKPAPIVKPAAPVKNPDRGDMVRVITPKLYTYNSKNWQDKGAIVEQGEAFTIAATHSVAGSKMYELVSGLFITANPELVEFMPGAMQVVKPVTPVAKPKEEAKVSNTKNEQPPKSLAPEFNEAVKAGITDGTYPNRPATRAEVAVMVLRGSKK